MNVSVVDRRRATRALPRHASLLLVVPLLLCPVMSQADGVTKLRPVEVASPEDATAGQGYTSLTESASTTLERQMRLARTDDAASLFDNIAGVNVSKAGGVSGLPMINGLADDRVRVVIDGMTINAACPNHMNSPLSYVAPSAVGSARVLAGITPVSLGGDSISGTIIVDSKDPVFGETSDVSVVATEASSFYRSNGDGFSSSVSATVANKGVSVGYEGFAARAENFNGGGDDGEVRSTAYKSFNHALTLAAREGDHLVVIEASQQYVPYEGYPNQYMDMTDNHANAINGRFEGRYDWGRLDARAYWQGVEHEMNFLEDKGGTASGGMPMNTSADNFGYAIKASFQLADGDMLRIGNELHAERLDDWWPPVAGSMMMSPNTFININGGKRDRLGTFVEWDKRLGGNWSGELGLRNDIVWTNAGDVQSYGCGMMCAADNAAAIAFNAAGHQRSFVNFDATAIAKYEPSETSAYEFGYARKSRAPNLYELYAWGRGGMASRMIGWFGDGNGYVGNLDLDSEVGHTVSATADFHASDHAWQAKITPYYTYVEDYIGVTKIASLGGGFSQFQFVNHNAELYGLNLSGAMRLWQSETAGEGKVTGTIAYVHGRDLTQGGNLYHVMPLNASIRFEETYESWTGHLELQGVARKTRVDTQRAEPETPSYLLVNLGSSYSWQNVRLDAGVDNLFDTAYDDPLGGMSLGDYKVTGQLRPVPGMGRSFILGITLKL